VKWKSKTSTLKGKTKKHLTVLHVIFNTKQTLSCAWTFKIIKQQKYISCLLSLNLIKLQGKCNHKPLIILRWNKIGFFFISSAFMAISRALILIVQASVYHVVRSLSGTWPSFLIGTLVQECWFDINSNLL
jgi:hypothetical protein